MSPFVESIKYFNGKYFNLDFHQQRLNRTRLAFYPAKESISLEQSLLRTPASVLPHQVYKCRVIYGEEITDIFCDAYVPRQIRQYYLAVCPDEFDYTFKLTDRKFFDDARAKLKSDEDYIYIKHGMITDSSFANLVFSDGHKYYTPANTLLEGTKRAYYLQQGIIESAEIKVKDIPTFKFVYTINAMMDLESSPAYSCDKLLLSHNHLKL